MSGTFPNSLFPDWVAPEIAPLKRRGHAAEPGSGPIGETCKTCKHLYRHRMAKTYMKCDLTRWTHGAATDIKASDPACKYWEGR